jgi:hypothetical protein
MSKYEVHNGAGLVARFTNETDATLVAQKLFHAGLADHWVVQIRTKTMWDSRKAYRRGTLGGDRVRREAKS